MMTLAIYNTLSKAKEPFRPWKATRCACTSAG